MSFRAVRPDELTWTTRPHEPDEPPRHVAELSDQDLDKVAGGIDVATTLLSAAIALPIIATIGLAASAVNPVQLAAAAEKPIASRA